MIFDTATWQERYRLAVGEDVGRSRPFDDGVMTVSGDSRHLFLSTPSGVRVYPLAPDLNAITSFEVSGFPASTNPGIPGTFTVRARNSLGGTLTSYTGTVTFLSTDPAGIVPANYTFTPADQGVRTFTATFHTAGSHSLTVQDVAYPPATGTQQGIVLPAPFLPIIIDDSGPGFTSVGSWTLTTGSGYLNDHLVSPGGGGSNVATWSFTGLQPGRYQVSATWRALTNRATSVGYTLRAGSTVLNTVIVNQQQVPNTFTDMGTSWQDLGGLYSLTGQTLEVRLTNQANGTVAADAIRLQYLGPLGAPEVQVSELQREVADETGVVQLSEEIQGDLRNARGVSVRNVGNAPLLLNTALTRNCPLERNGLE